MDYFKETKWSNELDFNKSQNEVYYNIKTLFEIKSKP